MDTATLRRAYDSLFEVAVVPDLGESRDDGWNADQILAHLLSVDAAVAGIALGVVSGARPSFDNRVTLDTWNLDRIIADHSGRGDLIAHVRRQGSVLSDIADQLSDEASSVLVPVLIVSNDALGLDRPIPLADLITGLAEDHIPRHTQQLLDTKKN